MANRCAGLCSALRMGEKRRRPRGSPASHGVPPPREGWQPSPGLGGSFAVQSAAAFRWKRWQACYGISGSVRVAQVAALPWKRWQDAPGSGGSFGVEYAFLHIGLKVGVHVADKSVCRATPPRTTGTRGVAQEPAGSKDLSDRLLAHARGLAPREDGSIHAPRGFLPMRPQPPCHQWCG